MNPIKFKIIFWLILIGSVPAIDIEAYAIKQQSEALEQEAIPTQDQEEIEFWLEPVQEDFSRFVKIRQRYNIIQPARIDGQEIIHVNFDGKESKLLDSQDLPSINGQSFFQTIRSLGEDQYAILPLMAFDTKVSKESFRGPVIRFGKPLFTPGPKKVGVLVLTAFADRLLESYSNISNGKI